jgi:hypothetical protein
MRFASLVLGGIVAAIAWLSLLVATGFSGVVVGLGLLGMVVLMGRTA